MTTNVIDTVRRLADQAFNDSGLSGKLELSVAQARQILAVINDQEREILGMERSQESLAKKVQKLIDGLDCYNFEEHTPGDESDNEVFEVFVGTLADHGRIFAIWDASSSAFHEPIVEDGQIFYREDVLYWRYSLPEPHETLDLDGAF